MSYVSNDVLIYDALRQHIERNKLNLTITYDGETVDPPRTGPFIHVSDTRDNPRRIAWGDGCPADRRGVLFMSCRIPVSLKWSVTRQLGYCGEVHRIFQNGLVIRQEGITVRIVNQPAMIGQSYNDGQNAYVYYPMAVQWRSFC